MNKANHIVKSGFIVSFFTIISRLTGFIRDSVFARFLGAGDFSDALMAASKLPNSFRRLLGEGAMSASFIPIFSGILAKNNANEISSFINRIFTILLVVSSLIFCTFQILMPFVIDIISPGFVDVEGKLQLTISLARINFFFLITISLSAFCGAILASIGKFGYFAFAPVILNISLIIGLVLYRGSSKTQMTYAASWATVVAGIIQLVILINQIYRSNIKLRIARLRITPEVKNFLIKMSHGLIASGIYQINIFIDTIFASMYVGGVSYLYYTDRINQLPLTLIGGTLGIILLPTISKLMKAGDILHAKQIQEEALLFTIVCSLFCVSCIFALGDEIVAFIYQHGEFKAHDTLAVALMLKIFALGFAFSCLSKIYMAYIFAIGETKVPMRIGIICLISNIFVNIIMYRALGIYAVAVATLISAILSGVIPLFYLKRYDLISFDNRVKFRIMPLVPSQILILFVQLYMYRELRNIFGNMVSLFIAIGISGIIYGALLVIFRVYTIKSIIQMIKNA